MPSFTAKRFELATAALVGRSSIVIVPITVRGGHPCSPTQVSSVCLTRVVLRLNVRSNAPARQPLSSTKGGVDGLFLLLLRRGDGAGLITRILDLNKASLYRIRSI